MPKGASKSAAAKAKAPAIITKLGSDELREYGSGNIGQINRKKAEGNYAGDDSDIPYSNLGYGVMREKMNKLKPADVEARMADLFPNIAAGEAACDCYVIVQELLVPKKRGSILITTDTADADQVITSFAKIVSIGPMAFKQDVTGEEFPGGASFAVGDIVRVPKIGNQEFAVDDVIFNYWKDRDIKGRITDLRKIVAMYF